jgi:hypothetical protein
MSISDHWLPPSSSLPRLRSLHSVTVLQLRSALDNLRTIYCPLRLPTDLAKPKEAISATADSGYASEDEAIEEGPCENGEAFSVFRLDEFERSFVVRWLTSLISRAEKLPCTEEVLSDIIDEASFILSSFTDAVCEVGDEALFRDFSFFTPLLSAAGGTINVRLKDAPLSGIDHTDVGLQSWGASIIFSDLLCAQPERFGLSCLRPAAELVELGAGTGLISLTLAKLLPLLPVTSPNLVATDYHPAVLENLRANIAMSLLPPIPNTISVKTAILDWSAPPKTLQSSVHMLFAADAVYGPEHATWLRDCVAHILAPDGLFWLMVTVRSHGKFEGLPDSAETAFNESNCPRSENGRVLRVLEKEMLHKKRGIGREDERGYLLLKIGWTLV